MMYSYFSEADKEFINETGGSYAAWLGQKAMVDDMREYQRLTGADWPPYGEDCGYASHKLWHEALRVAIDAAK